MNNFYQNKNVWIIGASFGIGEALYRELNDDGANLLISARSKNKIEELVANTNKNHACVELDVTKETDFDAAIEVLKSKFQKTDLIIFCAGIYSPMNAENFDLKAAKEILEVNLTGFVNFIGKIMPQIKVGEVAHIAIISSVAGYFGMPNSMCYGASKAGLSNLAESLYFDLKKYHTKVSLINPGFIKTRLTDQNKFAMPLIASAEEIATHIIKQLPKNNFEIYFPKAFVFIMKILKKLPFLLRSKILKIIK